MRGQLVTGGIGGGKRERGRRMVSREGYFAVFAVAEGGAGFVWRGDVDCVAELTAVAAGFVEHGV